MPARLLCALVFSFASGIALAAEPRTPAAPVITPEQEKFFEDKVRPILAASCLDCHGPKKAESGLRLDSRQAALEGGDSGERAVVPREPDRSLLVKAINHTGDIHMPPDGRLPAEQIAILTDWIRQGLPWPAESYADFTTLLAADRVPDHRATHWAYQPVTRPPLPQIINPKSGHPQQRVILNGIDAFIASRLEAAGLSPSPAADRRTLIRRATYDLVGLPPTPEDVEAFAADSAPDAYERLIDRLLSSPHYGERWGRHWLDVARYADTKGYAFAQERRFPYAYTYRDYVIRALNADLPYDQFVTEQLAADRLPIGEDKSSLAALGFLTTGRKFNNTQDDIDDQIDATTRGLLGLTVACARCHDHKYDAIPTEDYYSLYGVFASASPPGELPLLGPREDSEEFRKFEEELGKLRGEADAFAAEKHVEFLEQTRRQSADYLARVAAGTQSTLLAKLPFLSLDPKDLRPRMIQRWQRYLDEHAQADHPVLSPWSELIKLPSENFPERAAPVLAKFQEKTAGCDPGQLNPLVKAALAADVPATRLDVARIYGKLLTDAFDQWKAAGANSEALAKLPPETRQLADFLLGKDSPTDIDRSDVRQYLNRADRNKYTELQKKVESFQATSPLAPPRAMSLVDNPQPTDPRVFIRGNPARPGKQVPRQFLLIMSESERAPFASGSGRLELAQKIVAPDNPLARRVIVNRLWMHHFGEPLVLTPSDFGVRCAPPSHPELLDWLADELLENDWSLKDLHRAIMSSATYQQASFDRLECRAVDPENRLLWRANRRRLELEAVRDSLLALAGRLDTRMHGRPVELTKSPYPPRRAVYGFIDRQDLPNLFRVFDIASPDSSTPRRPRTTVPQQALFFMNSPFVVEQAQALAARPEVWC
ncbi:MAG: PSD1 and planctomycete cytochrome C domain-containing protein, partial [Planctomycetaceae bacterium]|nr:PSD1 and planctomycete cytochrome C domain-containing protein [Planctomycetaceae bacterium]